ncbi:MAG: hypothetical protein MUF75_08830 [Bacteroidia bacterium]|jgi:mono/diheme cytochrome c family protein|nr:hypothetical protein [Bacteroidia bacterium]
MKRLFVYCLMFLALFGLLGLTQCTKDKTPTPPEPCDPNKVYFQNDVLPIVSSGCTKSGCHDATSKVEGLNLSNYEGIMKIVKPGNPGNSEIMEVITDSDPNKRMPPAPAPALSQEQIDKISKWISQGALNNYCVADTGACATGTVSYSKDITVILTNCLLCHSGSSPSGGINLSTHAGVKVVGDNGKLYDAVSQNGKAQAMPPSGGKLESCDISKIKSWVDAGCPNN